MNEVEIRQKIVDVCRSKLPTIRKEDFDFVKRAKNQITKPLVEEDFRYDYPKLKKLCGQGKVYIRLNSLFRRSTAPVLEIEDQSSNDSSDEELPLPPFETKADKNDNVKVIIF